MSVTFEQWAYQVCANECAGKIRDYLDRYDEYRRCVYECLAQLGLEP